VRAGPETSISFEEFVRARSAALMRTALLLAGNRGRAEAEDLLQVALERAYRRWGRICQSGDPERYVRRVLVNAATDWWRQLRRRPERALPDDEQAGEAASQAGDAVADHASGVADRDFLLRALAGLPPRQRAVLVLRYFCDMPEAQIADALGCSTGTVKSQASRGLARLRGISEAALGDAADRDAAGTGGRGTGVRGTGVKGTGVIGGGAIGRVRR
jgi:RNA polymerase sigma-70 factor (sigma-E family)